MAQESFWRYPFARGWSREETKVFLERTIERYDAPGMAVSAVVVGATGELAGWAGLSVPTFLPEILPAVEVGWRLGEQYRDAASRPRPAARRFATGSGSSASIGSSVSTNPTTSRPVR
jgi:hypothetical protein